jgi:glycosyltransferase involved in cell wall biosynthesis
MSLSPSAPVQGGIVAGIDASRNRSGGAKAHLIGLIGNGDPRDHGIREVHLWSYRSLLDAVPNRTWLYKHCPPALQGGLARQMSWQAFCLPREASAVGCEIMLNTDAGAVSMVSPSVAMSRDMLSYEPGEMRRYWPSLSWLRLLGLRYVQNRTLRRAEGAIFLTAYAAKVVQRSCGPLRRVAIVPHGVGDNFRRQEPRRTFPSEDNRPIRMLYISNTAWYKHQWMVVRACELLRREGINLWLQLVGGGDGAPQRRLMDQVANSDPTRDYIEILPAVPHSQLPSLLSRADIFIFASSCENMPNTLLEAMASALPIACSDRGPMREVLADAGVYFNPEDPESIAEAIRKLVRDSEGRQTAARRAGELSAAYSWRRCAKETWDFVAAIQADTRNASR